MTLREATKQWKEYRKNKEYFKADQMKQQIKIMRRMKLNMKNVIDLDKMPKDYPSTNQT